MRTTAIQPVAFSVMADDEGSKSKHRTVRIEDDLWKPLEHAAAANGYDRSSLIRQLVRWYLSVPGAQLPQRPERTED